MTLNARLIPQKNGDPRYGLRSDTYQRQPGADLYR
jgi:hypothetical protein